MYQVGDKIAHPGHGACVVDHIEEKEQNGQSCFFYSMHPITEENTTILIPVDSAQNVGLRELISSSEAKSIIAYMRNAEASWIADNKKRKQLYYEIAKNGDLKELSCMCKTLMCREAQGKISNSDKQMLQRAQRKLISEIASALDETYEMALAKVAEEVKNVWIAQDSQSVPA